MAERLSLEWLSEMRDTGRWAEPPYWRDPRYLAQSQFSLDELDRAFAATERVYPPEVAKRIFRAHGGRLYQTMIDVQIDWHSELVALGVDASLVEPWKYGRLLERLRQIDQYEGARFELAALAAFARAKIPVTYEGHVEGRPDLSLDVGPGLLLELKAPQRNAIEKEEEQLWMHITLTPYAPRAGEPPMLHPRDVRFTSDFEVALRFPATKSWIWQHRDELRNRVLAKIVELGSGTNFPARDTICQEIDGQTCKLVDIVVNAPLGATGQYSSSGLTIDFWREASRIARGSLADGSSQIPADRLGAVMIHATNTAHLAVVAKEAQRWFVEEGASYANVIGAIVVGFVLAPGMEPLKWVVPVWRAGAPVEFTDAEIWTGFMVGLNWMPLRRRAWLERRGLR